MADFDLVVRGGVLVDGTGSAPRRADVAVAGGLVVEVGDVDGQGRQEVDADGAVVAPGFVDVHTHYDGQATWDSSLQPSSWHGVTTAVMGNCGVGFAPVRPSDHDRLIELMEGVEDIPGIALQEGLTWDWESFGDYLDALTDREYDMDVAAQVPHAALRVYAMGDRACAHERASEDEVAEMARLAAAAVQVGAIGFSTSRLLNHKSSSGEVTPSYDAGADELLAIARAIGAVGKGVLQVVTDFHPGVDEEFAMLTEMATVSGRTLSFTLAPAAGRPEFHQELLERLKRANGAGCVMRGQVPARGIGLMLGLDCTLHPFMMNPVWRRIADLPAADQAERMADPQLRSAILAAQRSGDTPNVTSGRFINRFEDMYELTDPVDYEPPFELSLTARAQASGRTAEELAYDVLVSRGGSGMIYLFLSGYGPSSFDALRELLVSEHTVPGLSDGGAHVASICDGSFPTTLLQHWVRDRDGERLDLPFVIRRQARDTARLVGLTDRGVLAPGLRADLNVIDLERLRLRRPEMRRDLPAGGRRLVQQVDGYRHTFVRGVQTYCDGVATGALPGRLVRA